MKLVYLLPVACALTLSVVLGVSAGANARDAQSEGRAITVTMRSLSYEPKILEVHVGDSLVWSNQAHTTHTATSDDDGQTFDTGNIEPGKSSTPIRFDKKGEFKYHCKIHGRSMSGTVVVGG